MTGPFRRTWLAVGLLTAVAGCQSRLNVDQTVQVAAGTSKDIEIDPPRYDQKMAVTVESDTPINVYVYLQKDRAAFRDALDKGKKPDGILAAKDNVASDTFEVTVPAKQGAVVTFDAMAKVATVKVKMVGK
jgi:hypothetical protein